MQQLDDERDAKPILYSMIWGHAQMTQELEYDLHGYHPTEIRDATVIEQVLRQAYEMGAETLRFIHGHGKNRDSYRPPFANTNTGWLGLEVRSQLRNNETLRRYMFVKINVQHDGSTVVRLRLNPTPTRQAFELD